MQPPVSPHGADFFDEWEASAQLDTFLKLMDAAAMRRDEEAVRLMLAQAFTHNRDTREVLLPSARVRSVLGEDFITWDVMYLNPEDQERIYLA